MIFCSFEDLEYIWSRFDLEVLISKLLSLYNIDVSSNIFCIVSAFLQSHVVSFIYASKGILIDVVVVLVIMSIGYWTEILRRLFWYSWFIKVRIGS
jgi:hypothetical protein